MKDSDKDKIKMLGSNKKQFRVGMAYPVSIPAWNTVLAERTFLG